MTTDELLTLKQCAEIAKVSERTIRRWIKAGELPASRHRNPSGQGAFMVKRSDLMPMVMPPAPTARG
jgi:excisionase family DNA binding protein